MSILAMTLEVVTVFIVAWNMRGKTERTLMNCGGIVVMLCQIFLASQLGAALPVIAQLVLYTIWIKCFYWRRGWRRALSTAVIAYGGILLYIEALYALWIPRGIYNAFGHFEISFARNALVLLTVCILCYGMKKVMQEHGGVEPRPWMRWCGIGLCTVMMLIFQFFREKLLIEYRWVSRLVIGLIFAAIVLIVYVYIRDLHSRIEAYKSGLRQRDLERHDYVKKLSYLEAMGSGELARELEQEEDEKDICGHLGSCVGPVLRKYKQTAEEEGIRLIIEASTIVPCLELSEKDALVIFGNLIENAFQAIKGLTAEEKWVKIRFSYNEKKVIFRNPCAADAERTLEKGDGITLVERAVKKNRGTMRYAKQEKEYITILYWE